MKPEQSPLGKNSAYIDRYDAALLFPIPRLSKRLELGLSTDLPFAGVDIWNAYELSWLNARGKPQVALAEFTVPAQSSNIIESKSLKLYLNSFNQTRFDSSERVQQCLNQDLSLAAGSAVQVRVVPLRDAQASVVFQSDAAECIDELDIEVDTYVPSPGALMVQDRVVTERLVSHLLKSNCLVTGQPDWGSVYIDYRGPQIDRASLLRYLISFRQHNEFHEQCVERIFVDLKAACRCDRLTVYARYIRRGGLDINPFRTDDPSAKADNMRHIRQ
ncbi:NADPH-dependent 7-cyano-7-deazaguanine reductase QueF [Reinekea sp.]|uniref:NADPH-dependent 7-cyano-7-deazaguanine reductase QueF n=1 Tax=Reinekea sp. TaxID=1970455 RepID=UPI002A81F141|nr:NADPH-dependent 7-cyano-7-deazaguanine reductase QueF [Reinekea sp.]